MKNSTPMGSKGTLASFTTSKGKAIVMTENDFPVLGKKPLALALPLALPLVIKSETSYACLARDWAKKKQEEEETKKLAESAAIQTAVAYDDRVTRELSAKLKQVRLQRIHHAQLHRNSLEEDESYIPPPVDDYDYNTYSVQEEEEEEEEYDPTVNYRRHKNELSNL